MTKPRSERLRRYPALGFLLAAALLASMLPSALRLPLSGPSASAELAPVPGKSDGQGDLSALNASSTGGLGSGAGVGGSGGDGSGGGGLDPDPPDLGTGRNVPGKRCVAGRQTEDPLSPTCVAVFTGDNGGATSQGVTRDEVRLVVMNCTGDGRSVYDVSDRSKWGTRDYSVEEAYVRYFNERYQTYGRRVRLFATAAGDKDCASLEHQKAQLQNLEDTLQPFLVFSEILYEELRRPLAAEAARLGMMFYIPAPRPRSEYVANAPYVIGYEHDFDDIVANVAGAVCARLAGRPARFAGDLTMRSKPRKLGILYSDTALGGQALKDGILRTCPAKAGEVVVGYTEEDKVTGDDETDQSITRMRTQGVTTVIHNGANGDFVLADAQKWYPEWLRVGRIGSNSGMRVAVPPPSKQTGMMGLLAGRRLASMHEQHHRMALAEGNCEGACATTAAEAQYNAFLLVFTGIQAAGPRLSAAAFDRGMRALPARQSRDPFVPSSYFAPGNYTFLKDFAFVWWDNTGMPPGGNKPGCWRLVENGLRYRAQDWENRPGDDDVHGSGQPCQADDNDL